MTNSQTTQVKVTLSNEIYMHLKSKAEKLGLNMAAYIKHLVISDIKDIAIHTFRMGSEREKIALKAINEYKSGKTKLLQNIDK